MCCEQGIRPSNIFFRDFSKVLRYLIFPPWFLSMHIYIININSCSIIDIMYNS